MWYEIWIWNGRKTQEIFSSYHGVAVYNIIPLKYHKNKTNNLKYNHKNCHKATDAYAEWRATNIASLFLVSIEKVSRNVKGNTIHEQCTSRFKMHHCYTRVMLHSHKILFKNINKTCLKVRNSMFFWWTLYVFSFLTPLM